MKLKTKYNDTEMLECFPKDMTPEVLAGVKKILYQTVLAICKEIDEEH